MMAFCHVARFRSSEQPFRDSPVNISGESRARVGRGNNNSTKFRSGRGRTSGTSLRSTVKWNEPDISRVYEARAANTYYRGSDYFENRKATLDVGAWERRQSDYSEDGE